LPWFAIRDCFLQLEELTMPVKNQNLHGNVPDHSPVVLLLIDVINDLEFEGNNSLVRQAAKMAEQLATLKARARKAGVACIYVNDNFGKWQSDFQTQVRHCLNEDVAGRIVTQKLKPEPEDYFVLKPKHSGFFSTTLDTVLRYLETHTLIVTGIAGDRCVLFTANDAYLRDFRIFIPSDCVISNTVRQTLDALKLMERVLKADIRPSAKLDFSRLKKRHAE
jgi:nicotinamidase-related amidase